MFPFHVERVLVTLNVLGPDGVRRRSKFRKLDANMSSVRARFLNAGGIACVLLYGHCVIIGFTLNMWPI